MAVIGVEMTLLSGKQLTTPWLVGPAAAVVLINAFLAVRLRDPASFGFRLSPLQSWTHWAKVTIYLGAIVLVVLLAAAAILLGILRLPISPPHLINHESQILPLFIRMCVYAPLAEEPIYRLAVCPPATAWFGPKTAIGASGVAFAAAHVLGGNPSPDNQIAGFLLAWAYLKSGSLAVPIALHFLGNLCAFSLNLILFYYGQ